MNHDADVLSGGVISGQSGLLEVEIRAEVAVACEANFRGPVIQIHGGTFKSVTEWLGNTDEESKNGYCISRKSTELSHGQSGVPLTCHVDKHVEILIWRVSDGYMGPSYSTHD
ncbi:hypothetical protein HD554DRAFT_2040114 [Boletus coccyginus]|nr:hypothetical protein HD554DRAFT_2040114 [Boletus coccyginus]